MHDTDLARAVAADLGPDVLAAVGAPPAEHTRAITLGLGITETMAVAGFLLQCAQTAMQVWQARQDRALLVAALANDGRLLAAYPRLDPERRLGLVARIVDKLVPESLGRPAAGTGDATRSLGVASGVSDRRQWVDAYHRSRGASGDPTRDFQGGALILLPFADQDWWIVYKPIGWIPDAGDPPDLPRVDVDRGFVTDLASVPSYLWTVLSKTGKYGNAAIYHDWLYWQQTTTREMADRVFDRAMHDMGVDAVTRNLIWAGVRVFGGKNWELNAAEKASGGKRVLKAFPDRPTINWDDWRQRSDVFL